MILMSTICACSLIGIVGCLLDKRMDNLEKRIKELECFLFNYEECVENEIGAD